MRKLADVRTLDKDRGSLASAHKLRRKQLGRKYTATVKSGLESKIRRTWRDVGTGKIPARSGTRKYQRLVNKQYGK